MILRASMSIQNADYFPHFLPSAALIWNIAEVNLTVFNRKFWVMRTRPAHAHQRVDPSHYFFRTLRERAAIRRRRTEGWAQTITESVLRWSSNSQSSRKSQKLAKPEKQQRGPESSAEKCNTQGWDGLTEPQEAILTVDAPNPVHLVAGKQESKRDTDLPQTKMSNFSKVWDLEKGQAELDTHPPERSSQKQPATGADIDESNELRRDVAELRFAVTELRQAVRQFSQESVMHRVLLRPEKCTSQEKKDLTSRPHTS